MIPYWIANYIFFSVAYSFIMMFVFICGIFFQIEFVRERFGNGSHDRFSDTSAPYRCTLQLHCYDSSLPCVGFSANLYCIFSGPFVQKRSGRNECVHLSTATSNS